MAFCLIPNPYALHSLASITDMCQGSDLESIRLNFVPGVACYFCKDIQLFSVRHFKFEISNISESLSDGYAVVEPSAICIKTFYASSWASCR